MAITEAYSSDIQGLNPNSYVLDDGMAYGQHGDVVPIANTSIVAGYALNQGWISNSGANDAFDIRNFHAIKGEMLMARETFSDVVLQDTTIDIKRLLANKIVTEMLKYGYIEFTKQSEPHTGDTVVRARVFVVPNSDVQILRTNGVK